LDQVRSYLSKDARVLDIGCADGTLFTRFRSSIGELVGIDPNLTQSVQTERCRLVAGRFPDHLPDAEPFDAIAMLAVLEHIPPDEQRRWAAACPRLLKPGGYLIITVPSPVVDRILTVLKFVRIIDGMSLEQHYGFEPARVPSLFLGGGMTLVKTKTFQLGCNNLFVFQKAKVG
jgi:SAM-dependent methyltransferase